MTSVGGRTRCVGAVKNLKHERWAASALIAASCAAVQWAGPAMAMGAEQAQAPVPTGVEVTAQPTAVVPVGAGAPVVGAEGESSQGPLQTNATPAASSVSIVSHGPQVVTPTSVQGGGIDTSKMKLTTAPQFANPFKHDIELTLTLTYNGRSLGELPVTLTRDSKMRVHTDEFLALIAPLLNEAGQKQIKSALAGSVTFVPNQIEPAGIMLQFDAAQLAVVVLRIDPHQAATQHLYEPPIQTTGGVPPAKFSAYSNINAVGTYTTGLTFQPSFQLVSAVRYGSLVLDTEFDGQNSFNTTSTNNTDTPFVLDRRYARLVYDLPQDYTRFYLGDLSPVTDGQQGFAQLGGIGVVRERYIFDPYRATSLLTNQTLLLAHNATVDVLINGVLTKQINLNAGSYNINNLPLQIGSNNVQIRVNDVTGASQTLKLNTYVDTLDLVPGDYEYAAYLGVLSPTSLLTPQYTGEMSFTGFYRKAFLNRQAFGVGLQASADTQVVNGEYRFIVLNGAKLDLLAAGSHSDKLGTGGSLETMFDQAFNRGALFDDLSVQVRYDTKQFTTLGETLATPNTTDAWQVSATYRRGNSIKWNSDVSLNYTAGNGLKTGAYDARFDNDYLLSRFWRVRATLEYERGGGVGLGSGVGGQLSLVWRPTFRTDYEADIDTLQRTETLSATRSTDNNVGSLGYSVVADNSNGEADLTGTGEYVGNRYDAGISVAMQGAGIGSIGNQQVITGRIGTSIAFADGHFAIGRQIIDSFALGYADQNLGKDPVILGQSLDNGHFDAESGLLGPALYGLLQSYTTQELHYDVVNAPAGYDVGPGVAYLKPAYHSGYAIKVGGDAYMSAGGTLLGDGAKPVVFVSGRVSSTTDKAFKSITFFTNSVGRFAIADLRPGMRYRVDLNTATPTSFEFVTPKDGKALVNLKTVNVKLPVD